jgi:hypothetical protein
MFDTLKSKFLQKGRNEETTHLLSQRIEDTGEHDKYKLVYWVFMPMNIYRAGYLLWYSILRSTLYTALPCCCLGMVIDRISNSTVLIN